MIVFATAETVRISGAPQRAPFADGNDSIAVLFAFRIALQGCAEIHEARHPFAPLEESSITIYPISITGHFPLPSCRLSLILPLTAYPQPMQPTKHTWSLSQMRG
jgi:hypothetical protein